MVRKQHKADEEFVEMMEPTRAEVEDLRHKLAKLTQERVNGRLQRRFDLHCKMLGIVRFDEYGHLIILQPGDYTRLIKINDKLETIQHYEQQEYLKTHPEEQEKMKEEFEEKMKEEFEKLNADMSRKFGISHEPS